jgi:hypothetical protein
MKEDGREGYEIRLTSKIRGLSLALLEIKHAYASKAKEATPHKIRSDVSHSPPSSRSFKIRCSLSSSINKDFIQIEWPRIKVVMSW